MLIRLEELKSPGTNCKSKLKLPFLVVMHWISHSASVATMLPLLFLLGLLVPHGDLSSFSPAAQKAH